MKKLSVILIILVITLAGCSQKTYSPVLHQSYDNIQKIELIDGGYDEHGLINTVVYSIYEYEIDDFIEDLMAANCYRHYSPDTYGYPGIWIYYNNGNIDIISIYGNEYVSAEYEALDKLNCWYYTDEDDICDLFEKYTKQ